MPTEYDFISPRMKNETSCLEDKACKHGWIRQYVHIHTFKKIFMFGHVLVTFSLRISVLSDRTFWWSKSLRSDLLYQIISTHSFSSGLSIRLYYIHATRYGTGQSRKRFELYCSPWGHMSLLFLDRPFGVWVLDQEYLRYVTEGSEFTILCLYWVTCELYSVPLTAGQLFHIILDIQSMTTVNSLIQKWSCSFATWTRHPLCRCGMRSKNS